MSTKPFTVKLSADVINNLERVAESAHMRPTFFAAMVLSKFSELKPEFALDAVPAVPKNFFRGRPGRPPASAGHALASHTALPQNTA